MRAPARELFRDAAFPASDASLFSSFSTPLAQFRDDITWKRPQVRRWRGFGSGRERGAGVRRAGHAVASGLGSRAPRPASWPPLGPVQGSRPERAPLSPESSVRET